MESRKSLLPQSIVPAWIDLQRRGNDGITTTTVTQHKVDTDEKEIEIEIGESKSFMEFISDTLQTLESGPDPVIVECHPADAVTPHIVTDVTASVTPSVIESDGEID